LAQLNANEKSPEQVHVCINQYSADEEPQYRVMLLACWNAAQSTIFGEHAIQYDISGWSNFFKNWFRRPAADFKLKQQA
jgi:hypothetical protein